jgi:hypothetical protein
MIGEGILQILLPGYAKRLLKFLQSFDFTMQSPFVAMG